MLATHDALAGPPRSVTLLHASEGVAMRAHNADPNPWPDPDPSPEPMPDPRPDPIPKRGEPPVRIIDLPPNTPTPGIPVEHS